MKKGLAMILAAVVLLCALTGGLVYTWKQRGRKAGSADRGYGDSR